MSSGSRRGHSIAMYFAMLTQDDDLLRGAALHVEHRPVSAVCLECGDEFSVASPEPACARCGSRQVRLDPEAPMILLTEVVIDEERGGAPPSGAVPL